MRNTIIFIFLIFSLPALGQVKLEKQDSVYRIKVQSVEENQYTDDTITQYYLPSDYVTKDDILLVIEGQIDNHQNEIKNYQQLIQNSRTRIADYISLYNQLAGPNAYYEYKRRGVANLLTGTWVLKERGVANEFDLSISNTGQITGERTGSIGLNADYEVIATGLYAFSLEFKKLTNGNWRAVRTTANGKRIFFLKYVPQEQE